MSADDAAWILVTDKRSAKAKQVKGGGSSSSNNSYINSSSDKNSSKNGDSAYFALMDSSYQSTPLATAAAIAGRLIDVMLESHYTVSVCDKIKSKLSLVSSDEAISADTAGLSALPGLSLFILGIGPFGNRQSFIQMCYSIALMKRLSQSYHLNQVTAFDPCFTDFENKLIASFGVTIMKDNNFGKITSPENTVFYMPHCPFQLYNNIIWSNWGHLHRTIIIGNSFPMYTMRCRSSTGKPVKANCCVNLLEFIDEFPIVVNESDFAAMQVINKLDSCGADNTDSRPKKGSKAGAIYAHSFRINHDNCSKAFNDTSIHFFDFKMLSDNKALLSELCPSLEEIDDVTRRDIEMNP